MMEKKVTSLSEAQFLRMRPANFMGSEMPQNIWMKEAIDNCSDIVAEGKATQAKFVVMPNGRTIVQMDNGAGISTRQCEDANGNKSTHLYNAVHKLYSGGNYGDENTTTKNGQDISSVAGTNGIGFKLITCVSKFSITGVSKNPSKYSSKTLYIPSTPKAIIKENSSTNEIERIIDSTEKNMDANYKNNILEFFNEYPTANNPNGFVITTLYGYAFSEGELITLEDADGNPVKQDPANPQFIQMLVPLMYKNAGTAEGFITISKLDDTIVPDLPEVDWLKSYIKEKIKSIIPENEDVFISFEASGEKNNYARPVNSREFKKKFKKELESGELIEVRSWEEDVEEIMKRPEANGNMFRTNFGFFDIVYSKEASLLDGISCVVQGARVINPKNVTIPVEVGNQKINISLPCVWKLSVPSKRISISYTDQTKVKYASTAKTNVKMNLHSLVTAAMKIPEIKQHVESEANAKFLKRGGKTLQSDFYWPANAGGDNGKTAREYFGDPFKKNPEYAVETLNRIQDDEDVIAFAKEKGYDIEAIREALS